MKSEFWGTPTVFQKPFELDNEDHIHVLAAMERRHENAEIIKSTISHI